MSIDRTRLEKLLGMLGSSFDGERANAARMIAAMAESNRMTIAELVLGTARDTHQEPPKQAPKGTLEVLRFAAANAQLFEFVLTEWELQFAGDVGRRYSRDYELSEKQLNVAERIARKIRSSGRV